MVLMNDWSARDIQVSLPFSSLSPSLPFSSSVPPFKPLLSFLLSLMFSVLISPPLLLSSSLLPPSSSPPPSSPPLLLPPSLFPPPSCSSLLFPLPFTLLPSSSYFFLSSLSLLPPSFLLLPFSFFSPSLDSQCKAVHLAGMGLCCRGNTITPGCIGFYH